MTPNYQNPENLRCDQYKDSSNLDARAALHRQFTVSELIGCLGYLTKLALQPNEKVLECGGGPGWIWRDNLDCLPSGCHITFTDLSPGMVAEAQAALSPVADRFIFQTVTSWNSLLRTTHLMSVVAQSYALSRAQPTPCLG